MDLVSLQKIMNRELKCVIKWLDANKLALNIEKNKFVLNHSAVQKITEPNIFIVHNSIKSLPPNILSNGIFLI